MVICMINEIFSAPFFLASQYTVGQVVYALFIILITAVVAKIVQWIVKVRIIEISRKDGDEFCRNNFQKYIQAPLHSLIFLIGTRYSLSVLNYVDNSNPIVKVLRVLMVISVVWLFYRSSHFFRDMEKSRLSLQEGRTYSVYAMASKAFNFFIIAVGFITILNELGYSASSLIAGLGIGGIAVALASKETLSSILSSVMIAIDKPFVIGDSIRIGAIEGLVEDIGFRVIKLRLPDKTLVTIPNTIVTAEKVENVSRRIKQKVTATIVISSKNELENILNAMDDMRKIIESCELTNTEASHVNFVDFKESNPVISVIYYIETTSEKDFQKTRNDINIELFRTLKDKGINLDLTQIQKSM